MESTVRVPYESPKLTTYGDLASLTKGNLAGSGDTTANFKAG
jgi:hypothetical protein